MSDTTTSPAHTAAVKELGPEVASSMPVIERAVPKPVDPGAAMIVQSMLAKLEPRMVDSSGVTRIGVSQIRNFSRCRCQEYTAFLERFAELLGQTTKDTRVEFTSEVDVPQQYQMLGAAYLVTRDGFDQWELFLSVSPTNGGWTLWQPEGAVHVLRHPHPRAGEPEVFVPASMAPR